MHRRARFQFAPALGALQHVSIQVGDEDARRDAVHRNAVRRPFHRQLARHAQHGALRNAVGDHAIEGHEGRQRRDVDNASAAARFQRLIERLAGAHRPVHVDVEDRLPLLLGRLRGHLPRHNAGCVHQHVDCAELRQHGIAKRVNRRALAHIAGHAQRAPPQRLDLLGHLRHQPFAASRHGDIGARARQAQRNGAAQARRPAHHGNNTPRQVGKAAVALFG